MLVFNSSRVVIESVVQMAVSNSKESYVHG